MSEFTSIAQEEITRHEDIVAWGDWECIEIRHANADSIYLQLNDQTPKEVLDIVCKAVWKGYQAGFKQGVSSGRGNLQSEIKALLGLEGDRGVDT